MTRYLLDTNIVSLLLRGDRSVTRRLVSVPMVSLCISSITLGELLFGLVKRPRAKRLHAAVKEFLLRVDICPWGSDAAECYGNLRMNLERKGKALTPLDMLIAAHALSLDAVLVTHDRAFVRIGRLQVENWAKKS